MRNIVWDKKFELGHEKIDFEHRIFLDLIRSCSLLDEDRQRSSRLLREVEKYADFHFLSEENLMLDINYPDYEEHRAEHEYLLAQLKEKCFEYKHHDIELSELTGFLFEWFALHTTQVDAKLTRYIKTQQ